MRFATRRLLPAIAVLILARPASPQTPSVASTSPLAVQPGATVDVTINGGNLAGANTLWTSFPAKAVLAPGVKNNGKNAGQVVFRLTVPKDTPVGVHAIRVVTPNGVSNLRLFAVDDLRTVPQKGGNTTASGAQNVKLPVAIEGVVGNLSRHYFQFDAKAGQRISVEALARRIGSALDPTMTFYEVTPNGVSQLTYADDTPGLFGDAQLAYRIERDGRYAVEIRDITYKGSANHRFRLRIGDFPCVTAPYPMGAKRGGQVSLSFAGLSVEDVVPTKVKVPADPDVHWINVGAKRKGGRSSGFAVLAVSDREEAVEKEPNDQLKQATRIALGANVNGRLDKAGDVDRFVFAAKKGQRMTFRASDREQYSPAALVLRLQNATGAQVAASNMAAVTEGTVTYTFPADGDYQLLVVDIHGRGGSRFAYRVTVDEGAAGFALSCASDRINVPAGGTTTVKVIARRRGYNGPIRLSVEGLPAGLTAVPTVIGPGRGAVELTLIGTDKAPRGTAAPIRIVGTGTQGKKTINAVADIDAALKAASGGYPYPTPVLSSALAAAAAPKAPFALSVTPQTVSVVRGKKATVTVRLTRSAAITEAVALGLTPVPKKNTLAEGLPKNLSVAFKPIPKGKTEIQLTINTNGKTPKGEFTATFVATHKKGKATIQQRVPGIVIQVK